MRHVLAFAAVFLLALPAAADKITSPASSFGKAKEIARDVIYAHRKVTFYCGCAYTNRDTASGGDIDVAGCGYAILDDETRGNRLEWEHVMPAARIGLGRDCADHREQCPNCFKANGKLMSRRDCCEKVDAGFELAHKDLHNLVPSVGEINADRSDLPYGIVEDEVHVYGTCDFEIGETPKVAEPADGIRGDIARNWLYMSETHGIALTLEERGMFNAWSLADPVDDAERQRDERIEAQQGNRNHFVRP